MSPRKKAIENKHVTYFGGKDCKHCGGGERYTSSGNCVPCEKLKVKSKVDNGYYSRHYEQNKVVILEKQKAYYKDNAEIRKETTKKWQSNNKEKVSFYKMSNKAMRRAKTSSGISGADLALWAMSQDKVCAYCYCDCENDYHIDHVIPLSKGGEHQAENLAIACPTCNLRKSSKDADDFRLMLKQEELK